MPVFLVEWETSGCIPVEAATPEEAKELAEKNWRGEIRNYSEYDVSFSSPKEASCIEEAYFIDPTFQDVEGDCGVAGSDKALKDLLPSNPSYTNDCLERLKKCQNAGKSRA